MQMAGDTLEQFRCRTITISLDKSTSASEPTWKPYAQLHRPPHPSRLGSRMFVPRCAAPLRNLGGSSVTSHKHTALIKGRPRGSKGSFSMDNARSRYPQKAHSAQPRLAVQIHHTRLAPNSVNARPRNSGRFAPLKTYYNKAVGLILQCPPQDE